jgi:hypothetical protein
MRICSRMRANPACMKYHAADDTLLRIAVFYGLRCIDNRMYKTVRAPSPTLKMGTEVVETLTHADALQRGYALHSISHLACVYHALQ